MTLAITMYKPSDNECWVIDRGADIIEKKTKSGLAVLNDWEHLVYCLWLADYMIRNGGDFANAPVMYPAFQSEASSCAKKLGLTLTGETFSMPTKQLEREYLNKFEAICDEIRNAEIHG